MQSPEVYRALIELAREAGLVVRPIRGRGEGEGEPAAASGVCRVGAATWVVLSAADTLEDRIDVLSGALRELAPEFLEQRYLPPALRARIGGGPEPG